MPLPRGKDGKLESYAWPGGYPILYFDSDGEVLCPSCANRIEANNSIEDAFCGLRPVEYFIHYEGPPEICAECNNLTESAYGEVEEESK